MIAKDYVPRANQGGELGNILAFLLVSHKKNQPRLVQQGVDPQLINELIDFAASLYPNGYDRSDVGPSVGQPGYKPLPTPWSELKVH